MMKIVILILLFCGRAEAGDSRKNYSFSEKSMTIPTSGSGQSLVAIFNPSTSTRRILIDSIHVYHEDGAVGDGIRWLIRRDATFSSSGTIKKITALNIGDSLNTSAQVGFNPVVSGGLSGDTIFYGVSYRDAPLVVDLKREVDVSPGEHFYLRATAMNSGTDVSLTIFWHEEGT